MQPTLVLILFILTSANKVDNETQMEFYKSQSRLISHLFSEYSKDVPPLDTRSRYSLVTTQPLEVSISLIYAKLVTVDEPKQMITMIFHYVLSWNDPRLTWNPSEFDEIEGFAINKNLIWRVDLLPWDSKEVKELQPDVQSADVKSSGNINLFFTTVLTFSCWLNVKKFPFQKQECNVTFGSNSYTTKELHFKAVLRENYKPELTNSEWTVVNVMATESNKGQPTATFTFHLQRSSAFYIVLIVMPSFVLTFLCVVGMFWSKFNSANYLEKLGLGFAAILAMCTILQIVETSIPKTRQLPSLTTFVMVNLLLETVAIFVVVVASKICSSSRLDTSGVKMNRLRLLATTWCAGLRFICLILFPLGAVVNLLTLLLVKV